MVAEYIFVAWNGGCNSESMPLNRLSSLANRLLLATSFFLMGIFSMVGVFDILNSSLNPVMEGFVLAPLELFLPHFLLGYVVLACFSVALAFGRRRLALVFLGGYLFAFWFFFFSKAVLINLGDSWFVSGTIGIREDVEGLYAFIMGLATFAGSRVLATRRVWRSLLDTVLVGAGVLGAFTGGIGVLAPPFWTVHVTNFQEDFLGLGVNLNFVTNELVFVIAVTILATYLWLRSPLGGSLIGRSSGTGS